jgi:hypothetical protein
VLVQDIALQQAKAQVQQLQQQLQQVQQQPQHASSFLGRIFGENPQPAAPAPPPHQALPAQGEGLQPVPQYAPPQPQYAPAQYAQPQFVAVPGGQPSFLRGAMQTAAGVAAGALAFEGVESILHGFGHGYGAGFGSGVGFGGFGMGPGMGMGGGFERPVEENIVNNYYDQPGPAGAEHHFDAGAQQFGNEPHFHESADQAALGGVQISEASYTTPASYNSGADLNASNGQGNYGQDFSNDSETADTSLDNMQIDDSGNVDDGGSFDDSGEGFDSGGSGF